VAFVALGGLGLINFITDLNRQKITLENWLLLLLAGVAAFWTLWPGAWEALRRRPRLALEGMAVLLLFALAVLLRIELLGPVAILFYLSFRFIRQDWKRPGLASSDIFVMLLVTVGSALVLFGELIYVRDIFNNRYNTVFKFWYQVWTLYGIAAAYATWRVLSWQPVPAKSSARRENFSPPAARPPLLSRLFSSETNLFAGVLPLARLPRPNEGPELGQSVRYSLAPRKTFLTTPLEAARPRSRSAVASRVVARWRWLFSGLLAVLLLLASLVPILGYWQETGHYANRVGLEGEVWYARQFPAEYPAMRWLRDYLRADPSRYGKVLEANGMNYSWGDRISVYTGLPTLVGWPFHELSWRGGYLDEMAIWQPWLDMDRIYETTDSQQALALLKQYKVRYVFVGQIENGSRDGGQNSKLKHFSPAALAKFGSFMKTIYADPINNIYIYAFY
jgi:uncharacterized membrane protein